MLRCLPFKQMLVLTRPWSLPNFGLGLVVLHEAHLSLERSFVLFCDDLIATDRQKNLHEMHMHKIYLSNSNEISLLKLRDKCGVYG
jgi:hypothetical protein